MARERRKKETVESGGNFYATAAQRVGNAICRRMVRALREGRVLRTEAYRLTGMSGPTFEKFAKGARKARGVSSKIVYVLDANVFIEVAMRYYAFDLGRRSGRSLRPGRRRRRLHNRPCRCGDHRRKAR